MSGRRIVVGVDGSESASAALTWAMDLAHDMPGSEIVAVHAFDPRPLRPAVPTLLPPPAAQVTVSFHDEVRRAFEDEWCAPLRMDGVPYRMVFRDGDPTDVLDQVAHAERAAMIVVGSHGKGAVSELVIGSVSHGLSHRATTPLVIIPRARAAADRRHTAAAHAAL